MSSLDLSTGKPVARPLLSIESSRLFMFPHPLAWGFVGLLTVLNVYLMAAKGFTLETGTVWPVLTLAVLAFVIALRVQREYPKIAVIAFTFSFFTICGKELRVLNYLTTSSANPFINDKLDAIDKWVGFDWFQYLAWVNESPILVSILPMSYDALGACTVLALYILICIQQHEKLKELLIVFFGLAFVTTCVGWFFPAQDAFSYYKPALSMRSNIRELAGVYHLPHFIPLRDGTMMHINLSNMAGMVEFPSFHTIAGLLLIWAMRGSLMIIPMAVVNLLMIVSAPVYGGHFLIDITVGVLLMVLATCLYHCRSLARGYWRYLEKEPRENVA